MCAGTKKKKLKKYIHKKKKIRKTFSIKTKRNFSI